MEQEAVAVQDYRQAGFLRSAFEALRPKPQMTAEECSPEGVDEQHAFFLQHGFILLRNILPADKLKRAQEAWTRAQSKAEGLWQAKRAAGKLDASTSLYYDLPNLLSEDDCFIDMIDSPALVPVMSRITGSPQALDPSSSIKAAGYTGCMRVGGMGGRVIPSSTTTHGPYSWHNDQPLPDDDHNPNYRSVKVFIGLFDLPPNGGATAVVPGTHRIPGGASTTLAGGRGAFKSSAHALDAEPAGGDLTQNLMPNYVEAARPAGCGIAFDSHIWHTHKHAKYQWTGLAARLLRLSLLGAVLAAAPCVGGDCGAIRGHAAPLGQRRQAGPSAPPHSWAPRHGDWRANTRMTTPLYLSYNDRVLSSDARQEKLCG
jgi:hypothetical protein